MIIRQFLEWFTVSDVSERVEAATTFCDAYTQRLPELYNHADVEPALTVILDDISPEVRRVLAEALAGFEHAPRHIIIGLAQDTSDISVPVLGRSLVLNDADLIDCLAIGDDAAQSAIALRGDISAQLAAAIAEIGCAYAIELLLKNPDAIISAISLARMAERFGHDADLRQALLRRQDLPIGVRYALVIRISSDLMCFANTYGVADNERSKRLIAEAHEKATLHLASEVCDNQVLDLVNTLRIKAQLTPSLLLRSLLCGQSVLFETALSALADMPLERVRSLCRQKTGAGFAAVYRRAKIPATLELAFKTAYREVVDMDYQLQETLLVRPIIRRVLLSISQVPSVENNKLVGLLHRLDSEAAKEEARAFSSQILAEPEMLQIEADAPLLIDFVALETEIFDFAQDIQADEANILDLTVHQCVKNTDQIYLSDYKKAA